MSRTRPRYVQTAHPLSPDMDEESWFISLSTAIGGFVGWLNARSQVDDMCQVSVNSPQDPINMCVAGLNGWGGTISADEAQGRLAEYTDMVYPSSILTGLALGFLVGALLVGARKFGRTKGRIRVKVVNEHDE